MASLAEIRARLEAAENKGQGQKGNSEGSAIFPHWNIDEGSEAVVRFLPDGDPNNTFFWVERQMIRMPFNGIKGEHDKQVIVQIPCVEMWGDNCPVHAEIRPWFKDPSLEDLARKYWKKRSYLFQGFVRDSKLQEDNTPDNPIRRFVISPQIFNIIKSSLMDPELEELPTDYGAGLDFRITKSSKGGYADYSTSKWARKETSLTAEEAEAIETYGLFDLKEFLPKRPTAEEIEVIKEMFEASVDGQPYDVARWGAYFRPFGVDAPANAAPRVEAPAPKAPVNEDFDDEPPFEADTKEAPATPSEPIKPETSSAGGQNAQDILAMIRARQTS